MVDLPITHTPEARLGLDPMLTGTIPSRLAQGAIPALSDGHAAERLPGLEDYATLAVAA